MMDANIEQKLKAFVRSEDTNLTTEQNRLWFLTSLDKNYPANNVSQFEICGKLDVSLLQICLSDTINHYPILRSTFVNFASKPVKKESVNANIQLRYIETYGDKTTFINKILEEEISYIFNLEKGPLIRFILVQCSSQEYVFLVNFSLLILDKQSVGLLVKNIFLNYLSYLSGEENYRNYTINPSFNPCMAEKKWLQQEESVIKDINFWRDNLKDLLPLEIMTDFVRPDIKNHLNDSVTLDISLQRLEKLNNLLSESGYKIEDAMLCIYSILLARYSQQSNITVGTIFDLRNIYGAEGGLGPTTNTVVKKISVKESHNFHTIMKSIVTQLAEEQEFYGLPFGYLLQKLPVKRELNRTPLFQVMYDFEDCSQSIIYEDGFSVKKLSNDIGKSTVDMTLNIVLTESMLKFRIDFNKSIFSRQTIQQFINHFETLIFSALNAPLSPVWLLPILQQVEKEIILSKSLENFKEFLADTCIHELVETQVDKSPALVAVTCNNESLTYRELDERANQLSHYLSHLNCTNQPVGIYLERSVNVAVAILGILKVGGAYVPIDPEYPIERINYMLNDSNVKYVITQKSLANDLESLSVQSILLEADCSSIHNFDTKRLKMRVSPKSIAYMIYTSGSTGKPKAVMLPHVGVVNDLKWRQSTWGLTSDDRVLQNSSFSFDPSVWATFWPLTVGACSVITPPKYHNDANSLIKLIKEQKISLIGTVPSVLSMLMENPEIQSCNSLKYVLSGGEVLTSDLLKRIFAKTNARLTNIYGPTEATINATAYECSRYFQDMIVPIGKPIRNQTVYVLDKNQQLLPFGVKGEIYIGGIGVARGYYNRPALTAEKFLPDPYIAIPGARMYRTGDLGRLRADGNIEFLGRVDQQIKLHGFRVEITEIEENLLTHPNISEVVILLQKNNANDDVLVAYVVFRKKQEMSLKEINSFLSVKLPKYMLPNALVCLPQMPKSVNGKIDINALPPFWKERHTNKTPLSEFSTVKEVVTAAFQDVLEMQAINKDEDFFELGGTSMMLTRLVTRLFNHFNISIPLHQFFKIPTISGVTNTINTYQKAGIEAVMVNQHVTSLEQDAILEESITSEGLIFADINEPKFVLLTGATGYLGVFLLEQLLNRTSAKIYCLVRANSTEHGMERIKSAMCEYDIWQDKWLDRILPLVGDLAKPQFGLKNSKWLELGAEVDIIYHNGALVNFAYPYSALRGPNVQGTKEALRLACLHRLKAVHYVSTIDVLLAAHCSRPFVEDDSPIRAISNIPGGYTGSKWVAEKLVYTAKERGIPVSIYRPGLIMGHTETGATQFNDYLLVAFRGFLPMNIIPEYRRIFDVVPVDYVAKSIVAISLQKNSHSKFYHLFNQAPVSLHQFLEWTRTFGYKFEIVPFDIAREKALMVDTNNPLYPLIPLIRDAEPEPHKSLDPQYIHELQPTLECANSIEILESIGINCPPMTESLTHLCLSYLVKKGFFPKPENLTI